MIEKFDLNNLYATSVDDIHWVYHPTKDDILEKINELVDAINILEPKHGRWTNGKCSVCGKHALYWLMSSGYYSSPYCPNCGAKMENER